jgi:hypothetical protein
MRVSLHAQDEHNRELTLCGHQIAYDKESNPMAAGYYYTRPVFTSMVRRESTGIKSSHGLISSSSICSECRMHPTTVMDVLVNSGNPIQKDLTITMIHHKCAYCGAYQACMCNKRRVE